jgi:hypothetical protein
MHAAFHSSPRENVQKVVVVDTKTITPLKKGKKGPE